MSQNVVNSVSGDQSCGTKDCSQETVVKTMYGEFCPGRGYWLVAQRDGSRRICVAKRFLRSRPVKI